MIVRTGFCNRCGLCELGRSLKNGHPEGDARLVVWDDSKVAGEADACYHRLIRDLKNGRPLEEVRSEWMEVEPTFDGDVEGYLRFPATPDAVVEGCSYRFVQDGTELPPKRVAPRGSHWLYSVFDRRQIIVLNDRQYGETSHGD